jgi:hypothetical protein
VLRYKKRAGNCYLCDRIINIILSWASFILLILLIALYFIFSLAFYIRERVSKYVTNGSKTYVIDVIGFLCVSLGSSTVQLHDSLGSRQACTRLGTGFSNPNDSRVWGVYYRRAKFCCAYFCLQKDSMQRKFIKKCFLFTVGSVCHVKRFTTWWKMFRWWRRGWNRGAEVAETTVNRHLYCGFRRTGKSMRQVYHCRWRICLEINASFSQVRISHVLRFISICGIFTDVSSVKALWKSTPVLDKGETSLYVSTLSPCRVQSDSLGGPQNRSGQGGHEEQNTQELFASLTEP